MELENILMYFITYIVPASLMIAFSFVILSRNIHSVEHWLGFALLNNFTILYMSEFIRHLLPEVYSVSIETYVSTPVGISLITFALHFFWRVSVGNENQKSKWLPISFYIPLVFGVLITLFVKRTDLEKPLDVQDIWIYFGQDYASLFAIIGGSLFLFPIFWMLRKGIKKTHTLQDRLLLTFMAKVIVVTFIVILIVGIPTLHDYLPPKPYQFIGLIFGAAIFYSMYKYNFLSSMNQQYETLFNLQSNYILIYNSKWKLTDWNEPSKLFQLKEGDLFEDLLKFYNVSEFADKFKMMLDDTLGIHEFPLTIDLGDERKVHHFLIDGKKFIKNRNIAYFFAIRDITIERNAMDQLEYVANHDQLTGVASRGAFVKIAEQFIKDTPERAAYFGLIDLNYFKGINDYYGHHVGDQVLQQTAKLLNQFIGNSGVVGRLGGDEFVLAIHDLKTFPNVDVLISRLKAFFEINALILDEDIIPIVPSVGISNFPIEGKTYDELYMLADERMYVDKKSQKLRK
jgi:diguanylate cyclase (GGDEF)-like protein